MSIGANAMRDTWPLLEQMAFPPIRRGRLDTLQVNVGYRCNQSCVHCHVNAGPEPHRGDVGRDRSTWCSPSSRAGASTTLDITGGAPELNRAFSPAGERGARHGRARDRPLQSDHPRGAGPGGPGRISRPPAGRDRRLDALLSRGQCRSPARQGRVRRLHPRTANGSTRSAMDATRPGSCSISSTIRRGRRCRRRRRRSRPTTSACSASATASSFNRLYTLANMPIQRFGAILIAKGEFDRYLDLLQARASRRQSRPRDVPQPDLGRLAGLRLRLRLQPDARSAARRMTAANACTCRTCSTPSSKATRSASPAIATAAPPARDRAAAAR